MTERNNYSRRDFVLRAGIASAGLALHPLLGNRLLAQDDLDRGILRRSATSPDLTSAYSGLRWRLLGPFRGGRVDAVSGVPGRPQEFYFGAVNGGVWKTIDAGRVWFPVFDSQPVASIGALAVAPSAPDTVYVGSGESTLRDSAGYGNGIYKSTDGGNSWTHLGLEETHHIGKIAVDPRNPNVVFVAAIGKLYAANEERGVFRSKDGGKSWEKVLYKNSDVGAVEVVIDPTNPKVIYAGLWNTRRPPWFTYSPTNGPGGGIYKSTDGGNTWRQLTKGLPVEGIGRTGIAVAPTNPKRVYAIVDCLVKDPNAPPPPPPTTPLRPGQTTAEPMLGGFFRSNDAGASWTRLSTDTALWGRGWYFEKVAVDPKNADNVYVPNVAVNRSKDGGKTWDVMRGSPGGDDYHQAWVSPNDSDTMIVASDQGTIITRNARANDPRDVTWSSWLNQPTAQLYHLSVDYRFPYWVTGAQQDSGAIAVRSRGKFAEISMHDWEPIGPGGESGTTAGDPLNPGIVFGGSSTIARWDLERNIEIKSVTSPKPPEKARTDWTEPLVLSKADQRSLYYANQFLFRSTDAAKTWTQISPDLTRPELAIPPNLDETAAKQVDTINRRGDPKAKLGVIFTIAPSPLVAPIVWVGTDDGLIHVTADAGQTWKNVTPAQIGPWSRVTTIEGSHFDTSVAYASVDRHQLQDFAPYIYRTRDGGATWQPITTGLSGDGYVHVVCEDPERKGLLFAGTERGAFISFDDGERWLPLQLNLPVTSVRDFEIYSNDLIVATFGRGFWLIDDIAPLRQVTDAVLASDVFLFKPSDVTYVAQPSDHGTPLQKDEPQSPNPVNGAMLDYYLQSDITSPLTLEIVDSAGKVVKTFSSDPGPPKPVASGIPNVSPLWQPKPAEPLSRTAGMHRVVWVPLPETTRARGESSAPEPLPLIGKFTARLTANGKTLTRELLIKPDPRSS